MRTETISRKRATVRSHHVTRAIESPRAGAPAGEAPRAVHRGLCSTCIHDSTCTFPRSAVQPVLCCDEFEGAGALRERIAAAGAFVPVVVVEPGLSEAPADVYARRAVGEPPAVPQATGTQPSRMSERFILANREWYPGLCKQCGKSEDCGLPKPAGGVFACEEFA